MISTTTLESRCGKAMVDRMRSSTKSKDICAYFVIRLALDSLFRTQFGLLDMNLDLDHWFVRFPDSRTLISRQHSFLSTLGFKFVVY
jgi:hypothetical protein